jgi:hypothetical protein
MREPPHNRKGKPKRRGHRFLSGSGVCFLSGMRFPWGKFACYSRCFSYLRNLPRFGLPVMVWKTACYKINITDRDDNRVTGIYQFLNTYGSMKTSWGIGAGDLRTCHGSKIKEGKLHGGRIAKYPYPFPAVFLPPRTNSAAAGCGIQFPDARTPGGWPCGPGGCGRGSRAGAGTAHKRP